MVTVLSPVVIPPDTGADETSALLEPTGTGETPAVLST